MAGGGSPAFWSASCLPSSHLLLTQVSMLPLLSKGHSGASCLSPRTALASVRIGLCFFIFV